MQPTQTNLFPKFNLTPYLTIFIHNILKLNYHDIVRYLIIFIISLFVLWIVIALLFKLLRLLHHRRQQSVFLEITPPQTTEISPTSTTQLFNLICSLISQRSWLDRLVLRQSSCSFEIVSRKTNGIQYLLKVPEHMAGIIEKNIRSYLPGIKIKQTTDYLPDGIESNPNAKVMEFKLSGHFSLPLNEQADLAKHDPLAYLTGNMTQLKNDEVLAIQIILRPLNGLDQLGIRRKIGKIQSDIRFNRFEQNGETMAEHILNLISDHLASALCRVADTITGLPPIKDIKTDIKTDIKKEATPADKEKEVLIKSKLNQPLFEATIRTLLMTDKEQLSERKSGLTTSFTSFDHFLGQSISSKWDLKFLQKYRLKQFVLRFSGSPLYLTSSEVGALYHFPFKSNAESSELVRVKSRELPAPLSLKKSDANFDVVVGINQYAGEVVPIGLTLEQRQKHMYVIGKTGMGKTTLLTTAIYQDMLSGKGLAVLDPHGDMLQEILGIIPENRRKDVILFDPSDRDWPIGLNILSPGINFSSKDDEQARITSSVLSVFKKLAAKEFWGPKMEHILTNATMTALQMPNPSLFTLQQLLTDKSYQKKVAATLKDPVLKQFWQKEFALLGTMQLSSVTAPLTQRIGHFITTKMSRHILLQEKTTISISQIMDEGKILLVNLSKGDLGEDQSFFFGTILTSIIWMAAYQRINIPENKRRDFFLYVDEFQNFATPRFSEITSEGRKFHVSLTASHQNIAQVEDPNILKVVAGNANTIVCLKASPDDEKFILPFMEPEVEKGDIVNLAPYHFFMKVTNETSENAFSGVTVPLDVEPSDKVKSEIINYSRKHYATPIKKVEEYLEAMFTKNFVETPKVSKKTAVKVVPTKPKIAEIKTKELCQRADTEIDVIQG